MLHRLELRCFRKHENLDINFTAGVNAIRGPNEGGKSTILEAMLYAAFGSGSLRTSMEETVTKGRKESELSVKMVMTGYWVKRSTAGAELWLEGDTKPFVTGQKQVSAEMAKRLGADAKTCSKLMLAGQNALAGTLSEGPTAVSNLMSQLADCAIIDRVMETAQSELLVGGDRPLRDKLAAAEAELGDAVASQPVDGSVNGLHNDIQVAEFELGHHQTLLETNLQPALDAAQAALEQGERTLERYRTAFRAVGTAEKALEGHKEALEAAKVKAGQQPDAERMQRLRAGILAAEAERPALEAWAAFQKLPKYPESFWEGDESSFNLDLAAAAEKREHEQGVVSGLKAKIETLKGQRITSGKCPTCGHAAQSDEHVAQHNGGIEAKIAPLTSELLQAQNRLRAAMGEENDLKELDGVARRYLKALAPVTNFVDLDEKFYPPRAAWRGAPPVAVDTAQAKRELASLERQEREAREAEGQLKVLRANVDRAATTLHEAQTVAIEFVVPDMDALGEARDVAYLAYTEGSRAVREAERRLRDLQEAKRELERRVRESEQRIETAKARVAECREDLDKLARNNVFMGKLRKLRPEVTDAMWNRTLAAASTFMSQMRGLGSVITKDAKGFAVNGTPFDGLSGSTQDILALAIRVALTLTFLPAVPFLVLDEPAHGCSKERTANLLGFIASAGFQQVLLATHDEMSESVAQNVILLVD
jgi:ABC-type transport system involved in cytochrome c biogenesis ATPase subunit